MSGGRGGLYYRKHLSGGRGSARAGGGDGAKGCALVLVGLIAIVVVLSAITWLADHPAVLVGTVAVALAVILGRWTFGWIARRKLAGYKQALDKAFVEATSPPSEEEIRALKNQQKSLSGSRKAKKKALKIEEDVYEAVLDRVLDDGHISPEEAALIAATESALNLSEQTRLQTKKEIFTFAYGAAIEDREITEDELTKLTNLLEGLAIPETAVKHELKVINEIIDAQKLKLPLDTLPREEIAVSIQKSEDAFYQSPARVLSQRKSRNSLNGYEFSMKREGTLVVTNKRLFVVGDGTTNIRYSDIADLDVDIDDGHIEISKVGSGRPTFLQLTSPILVGRMVDLLMNA